MWAESKGWECEWAVSRGGVGRCGRGAGQRGAAGRSNPVTKPPRGGGVSAADLGPAFDRAVLTAWFRRTAEQIPGRDPHGAVFSVSHRGLASLAGPGRKKSKACRGCGEKTEGGCISGYSECSVCGRKEKEKGKNRKRNGYIWTPTRRWT